MKITEIVTIRTPAAHSIARWISLESYLAKIPAQQLDASKTYFTKQPHHVVELVQNNQDIVSF